VVYEISNEHLYDLLYFYINYIKVKQENEQTGRKSGGMKQKGGLTQPLCTDDPNDALAFTDNLLKDTAFIDRLLAHFNRFIPVTRAQVIEFAQIFIQDLDKDLSDKDRNDGNDLTKKCLRHIPKNPPVDLKVFIALLKDKRAIITGEHFLQADSLAYMVQKYSILDITPSGLKLQVTSWRDEYDKLLIIPNISGILDSAGHADGGKYNAYSIQQHRVLFSSQLTHIINPAIIALKSFYTSLENIDIIMSIHPHPSKHCILLTVQKQGRPQNTSLEVPFGPKGISVLSGVIKRLTTKNNDKLLTYLNKSGFDNNEATDICLFFKHMGDPMQYIQALYHNTTMPDQQKRQRQIACNTFYDKYGVQQILETAGETAFLTADRNAFRAAKAIGNNVLIGVEYNYISMFYRQSRSCPR